MRWPAPSVPPLADDAAIITASGADPERFAAVFDRHAPVIHRYIARRVGREVAADLVAETFLAAFRRRGRYGPGRRDALPWLYGIATHLVSQHRRAEARQLRIRLATIPEPDHPGDEERLAGDITAQRCAARSWRCWAPCRTGSGTCCSSSPGSSSATTRWRKRWASRSEPSGPCSAGRGPGCDPNWPDRPVPDVPGDPAE